MSYIEKILNHIKNGTFLSRIQNHSNIELEKKWRSFYNIANRNFIIKKLNKNLNIKLYKNHLLSKAIYLDIFEYREIEYLKNNLKKGDVFIDVGANIGLFSLVAAKLVGNKGLVLSFEPTKKTYEKLMENVKINTGLKNINTFNIAISNQDKLSTLYLNDEFNDALNSLVQMRNYYSKQKTECKTLNYFVEKYNVQSKNVFIKIDVEGHEIPVLEGLENKLKEGFSPMFLIEFNDKNANKGGFNCLQIINLLKKYKYSFYEIDDGFHEIPLKQKDYYTYTNVIAHI